VYGDGEYDLGQVGREYLPGDELPALPCLVNRILGHPKDATYTPMFFPKVQAAYGKGSKWGKKAMKAMFEAGESGFTAIVILIDRDGDSDAERVAPIREARNATLGVAVPCAVGQAVEAFDAWMIVDGNAIRAAGGDAANTHTKPETLAGKEGSGRHPKDWAIRILKGKDELAGKYAVVAAQVDMGLLERCCPDGFRPFAADVKKYLGPLVVAG